MIDFPASPSVGQLFSSGGFTWRWDGTRWVSAGAVPTVANPNKFINPFCEFDQVREGVGVSITNAQQYLGDGHMGYAPTTGGAVVSGGRGPGAPAGFQYHLGFTVTTAASSVGVADNLQLYIPIEAGELFDTQFGTSAAQPLTVSFWANASIAGTYAFSLRNGASARSYVTSFTIAAVNTWQFFAFTIPGDIAGTWTTYGNGVGMYAGWCLACGANNQAPVLNTWATGNYFGLPAMNNALMTTTNGTFMIGPHKLERGSQATPIVRESYQSELAACQRYFEKSYAIGVAPGTTNLTDGFWADWYGSGYGNAAPIQLGPCIPFKVPKRAVPTLSVYSTTTGTAGKMRDGNNSVDVAVNIWGSISVNYFNWYASSSIASNNVLLMGHFVADARL